MVLIIHKIYFCLALNFGFFLFIIYTLPLRLTSLEFKSLDLSDFKELLIFINNFFNFLLIYNNLVNKRIVA